MLEGPLALQLTHRCWRPNQGDCSLPLNTIRFGFTQFDNSDTGESIIVCRTAEHRVEIHCHGGRLASDTILRKLVSVGAKEQSPYGRESVDYGDAIVSEAREDLTRAATLRTTAILLDQFRGALGREIDEIKSILKAGETAEALKRISKLKDRSQLGSHLLEPWRVVLAGPPNSGKSSLLNLLLGYSRAIVHEQAGTTRDLLSERTSFDGWPIELIDCAGIRNAADTIEATGIKNTLQRIASADCTLLLVDQTTGWTKTHTQILNHCSGKAVLVITKSDLIRVDAKRSEAGIVEIPERPVAPGSLVAPWSLVARVETSSVTGAGLKELISAVVLFLVPHRLQAGDPVPFRQRHRDALHSLALECNSVGQPKAK